MKRILGMGSVVIACVLLRLMPHAPNVAPMTAFALFAGYAFSWRRGFLMVLIANLITDFFIGFYDWRIMVSVYGSYALVAVLSDRFNAGASAIRAISSTWASALIFFTITNGAVWMFSAWYAKTPAGLLSAYVNGLPFLRNSLLGDMGYGALFYVGYVLYLARAGIRLRLEHAYAKLVNTH